MAFSLKAMWNYKCPRCRRGDIFTKPFNISKPLDMPENCSYCNQKIEPEPGFYYGAMFISYIVSSLLLLPVPLALVFIWKWSFEGAMGLMILITALLYFKFLRGSRSLWLHTMVKYDPVIAEKVNEEHNS